MKKVVIPVDYSENSKTAAKLALHMFRSQPTEYIFYHVYSVPLSPDAIPEVTYTELASDLKQTNDKNLRLFAKELLEEIGMEASALEINYVAEESFMVSDALAAFAKKTKADLVAMGTKGATGLKKIVFGSNTSSFIGKSPCPLLVVPPNFEATSFKKVGYASDLTNLSKECSLLADFFRYMKVSIDIVHVHPVFPEIVNLAAFDTQNELSKIKRETMFYDFNIVFQKTDASNEVLEGMQLYVETHKPDMLAIFTVKRSFWDKFFDPSITEEIVFAIHKPIVIFQAK
jgi:nucleotide-binding universal stress UspA family protein